MGIVDLIIAVFGIRIGFNIGPDLGTQTSADPGQTFSVTKIWNLTRKIYFM
jgi:hypothetical protein